MSEAVFRHYSREALDREYDNQKKIPDFASYVAYCRRESDAARRQWSGHLDVPYGKSQGERLDIFPARAATRAPVEVYFHGGYWRLLDKSDFSYVANGFVPHGVTTVIVNYALIPTVDMDELIRQCRAALAWVFRNIAQFGGDPERLYLSGHSAGGHIVAMLLATDWPEWGSDLPREIVKGATAISGVYDLEPMRHCFLNETLKLEAGHVARNSPVRLQPACPAPLLVTVGGEEGDEFLRQGRELTQAWHTTLCCPEMVVLPGENHFSIRDQLGDPASRMIWLMRRRWTTLATAGPP